MTSTQPDVEILVHISAPSRTIDDVNYRQLAQAYLDFKPQHAAALPSLPHQHHGQPAAGSVNESNGPIQGQSSRPVPTSSSQSYATPAPGPLLLDSQDLSFQSAMDNRESPRLGETIVSITQIDGPIIREHQSASQASWHAPPSEIADSYPMPHPSLLRNSPTKILQRYLGSSANQPLSEWPEPPIAPVLARASPKRRHIEVPSSPIEAQVEVPSSQPELPPLLTIPSSPLAPSHGHDLIPLSADDSTHYNAPQIVPTSDDVMDVTHISNSFIEVGSVSEAGHRTGLELVQSDDGLDVTHISGSSVEDHVGPVALQGGSQTRLQDETMGNEMDVTRISGSTFNDNANTAQEPHSPEPSIRNGQDFVQVSESPTSDHREAAPSQKRALSADQPIDDLEVTRTSSSSFEVVQEEASSPPLSKRRRGSRASSLSSTTRALEDFEPPAIAGKNKTPTSSITPPSFEIIPSSPPTGLQTLDPTDLIPPQLSKLAHDLSARYRPSSPSRPLDDLERGYWLLDYSQWSSAARVSTWAFLERYVSSGLAGWGLWCKRNEAEEKRSLRVYCWGCAVKHAFLLLYLASERRLKGTGAVWIDAEGEAVLEVPAQVK